MLKSFQFMIRTVLIFLLIAYIYDWSNNYQFSSFIKLIYTEVVHGHDSPEYKLAIYNQMVQRDPYDASLWGQLSLLLFHDLKQPDEALVSYHQAITVNPDYIYPNVTAEGIRQDLTRMKQELEEEEKRRLARGPLQPSEPSPPPQLFYRDVYFINAQLEVLQKMGTRFDYPNNAEDWMKRGNILSAAERYLEALNSQDQAIRINPQSAQAWIRRGAMLAYLEDYEGSLSALNQAIKLAPHEAYPWGQKCMVLYQLGRYQEAMSAANQAIFLDPDVTFFQVCHKRTSKALNS